MLSETGWQNIRRQMPDAIAYAIDNSGMQSAFDAPPFFHRSGRWLPSEGKKVNLGVMNVGGGFDGSKSLQWAPDYTGHKVEAKEPEREAMPQSEVDDQPLTTWSVPADDLQSYLVAAVDEVEDATHALLLAVAKSLPKTKLAKIQPELDALKTALDRRSRNHPL